MKNRTPPSTCTASPRCAICRCAFRPHPRVGMRQMTCGKPVCRKEQKRRAQRSWSRRNPGYWGLYRVKKRIRQLEAKPGEPHFRGPPAELARFPQVFGLKVLGARAVVLLMLLLRLCFQMVQDAIKRHERWLVKSLQSAEGSPAQGASGHDGAGP